MAFVAVIPTHFIDFLFSYQHFVDGKSNQENPDPQAATVFDQLTPARPPPKLR